VTSSPDLLSHSAAKSSLPARNFSHPFFYSKVDERTGFITRNILCFPIKDSAGIVKTLLTIFLIMVKYFN
jgi:hypothetical protein